MLSTAMATTIGTALMFVCIAAFRLPRRNWLGFMPMPTAALASWSMFAAIQFGFGPNVIWFVGALAACAAITAWLLICTR